MLSYGLGKEVKLTVLNLQAMCKNYLLIYEEPGPHKQRFPRPLRGWAKPSLYRCFASEYVQLLYIYSRNIDHIIPNSLQAAHLNQM